jgi:hypothetical protein
LQNQNVMSQSAAAQVRRLRTYVRRDVPWALRRWSWRGRRRVAHDVRRAELRAKRALGTNVGVGASGVHAHVSVHALLLGEENSLPAAAVARIMGALLYPSTRLPEWPMVVAARDTADEAARERLQQFALVHIAHVGHYFGCRTTRDLDALVDSLRDATGPIRVRRVHASDCFSVVSGHTAAAGAALRGEQTIEVIVERTRTWTPLQEMLRAMSWLEGRVELYQRADRCRLLPQRCSPLRAWTRVGLSRRIPGPARKGDAPCLVFRHRRSARSVDRPGPSGMDTGVHREVVRGGGVRRSRRARQRP